MKKILLGNEAIVQGAMEAGVNFVSTYPGTPASEIGNTFAKIAKEQGVYPVKSGVAGAPPQAEQFNRVYFEFSTNEKVALEAAIGASFSGLKCLVAMKSFGLNVASDALLPLCYTGTKGPMVIVVADDPSCWSSGQSEQNSRAFAYLAHIPILEPSDAQEAKDFTILAFEISEQFNSPVILRTTTRVSHQRMPVDVNYELLASNASRSDAGGGIKNYEFGSGFIKNPEQFCVMPNRVLEMKKKLLEKIESIRKFAEKSNINKIEKASGKMGLSRRSPQGAKVGIIVSGVSYLYVKEAMEKLNLDLPILKLGFFYPLPTKKIENFIKNLKKVLVVEELDPYLEKEIKILAKSGNCKLEIFGKDFLPEIGELNFEKVAFAVSKIVGKKYVLSKAISVDLPNRSPRLCPNCPYWAVFGAVKRAAPAGTIFGGDIGCYMMAGFAPHNLQDYLLCMGSSVSVAHGIEKASSFAKASADKPEGKKKIISFMGDSTFFHSGIPALINAVFNKSNQLIIIMDNRITAMTGHQPNPGMGKTGMGETVPEISIEKIARACGVENIKTIEGGVVSEFESVIKEFLSKEGVSIIIAKQVCALLAKRLNKK